MSPILVPYDGASPQRDSSLPGPSSRFLTPTKQKLFTNRRWRLESGLGWLAESQ